MRDKFGQIYYSEDSLVEKLMIDPSANLDGVMVPEEHAAKYNSSMLHFNPDKYDDELELLRPYIEPDYDSIEEFDKAMQANIHMPDRYKDLDIEQHVLALCKNDTEIERAAYELTLYQDKGLYDLLRYMVYMIDVFREKNIVWGVGRGSSVSSFVLYLLGVHKINSIEYGLDIHEFLR